METLRHRATGTSGRPSSSALAGQQIGEQSVSKSSSGPSGSGSAARWGIDGLLLLASERMHVLAAFALFALAFLIFADVTLRLLGRPIAGTAELVANAVVAIAFLQLPHAVRCGGFLRVELLDGILPAGAKRTLFIVSCVLGIALFLAVAYSSWPSMVEAWEIGEFDGVDGSLKVPTAPVRTVLVAASVMAAANFAVMLAIELRRVGRTQ
jgi:TRAP-type C4-dicarboxylate transport system permease small subunit